MRVHDPYITGTIQTQADIIKLETRYVGPVPTQHVAVHLGLAAHKIKVAHRLILSLGTFTLIVFFFYKVGQISAQCIYIPVTISSIDRFLKFFYHRNQEKMCSNTVTKNSTTPHMCSYTTW